MSIHKELRMLHVVGAPEARPPVQVTVNVKAQEARVQVWRYASEDCCQLDFAERKSFQNLICKGAWQEFLVRLHCSWFARVRGRNSLVRFHCSWFLVFRWWRDRERPID